MAEPKPNPLVSNGTPKRQVPVNTSAMIPPAGKPITWRTPAAFVALFVGGVAWGVAVGKFSPPPPKATAPPACVCPCVK